MATSVFTTWADLYDSLLDELASGNISVSEVSIGGKTLSYSNKEDLLNLLEYVRRMMDREAGSWSPRVYAKQGGRGS